jgi:hypothetical protein
MIVSWNPRYCLVEVLIFVITLSETNAVRYRTTSGSLTRPTTGVTSESGRSTASLDMWLVLTSLPRRPTSAVAGSSESAVTALDSRLDRIASWVKNVERECCRHLMVLLSVDPELYHQVSSKMLA